MQRGDQFDVVEKTKVISGSLFEGLIKPDLESGRLAGPTTPDDLRDRYGPFIDSSIMWESLDCLVNGWKEGKTKDADSAVLANRIMRKHARFPKVCIAEKMLGKDIAERYRAALENLESTAVWASLGQGKDRWKKDSIVSACSLVIDVISPFYGTGRLADEYEKWRKSTYGGTGANGGNKRNGIREFWKTVGVWTIRKSNEQKWIDFATHYGHASVLSVKRGIDLCRRFRQRLRETGDNCLRYIPGRKPNMHSMRDFEQNMTKIKAYLGRRRQRFD